MIRTKGEAGSGNIVEAVRHMRAITKRNAPPGHGWAGKSWFHAAKELGAPLELVQQVAETGQSAGAEFFRWRNRHARRRFAGNAAWERSGFRRLGYFQVR